MPNLASWIRPKDEPFFRRAFAGFPEVKIWNAAEQTVAMSEMDGLLLTGGPDIAPEFLKQDVPEGTPLDDGIDPVRDRWEFQAAQDALALELPILAICKGMQLFNVALGGTLKLDIAGHNAPEMKDHDVQELRTDRSATHRLARVNSSHHQAVDSLGEGLAIEAWSAKDDIVEQVRLRAYPFALGVQYHPERGDSYGALFADFAARVKARAGHGKIA
ncbi:MAG: gamma-glutamyl-gamma-aminobutyrate hydrolase family protein [Verrucomicrobiota bacterium]|nr:gamma-glutamyl-gamma-aminobutyrate hydrolase family protein [Verrucomicrobiota bacterium]